MKKPTLIDVLSPVIEGCNDSIRQKAKIRKQKRSTVCKKTVLFNARMAISELVAQYKKEAESWPENLPNYYLEKSEELTALYQNILDWEVELHQKAK